MNKTNLFAIAGFYGLLFLILSLLADFGLFNNFFSNSELLLCDSVWYHQIKDYGYFLKLHAMCNLAFFPLFPYFWKITHLNAIGISVVNLIIFSVSLSLLFGKRRYPTAYILTLLTFPTFFFFFIPYSESIFFLFGTLLLVGLDRSSDRLIILGLIGCGLTRSVSTLFIPIIFALKFYDVKILNIASIWSRGKTFITYTLVSLIALIVVVITQYLQTGRWFYFLYVQRYWGRSFQLPSLPFTTISPHRILGIDTIALTIGLLSGCFLIKSIAMVLFRSSKYKKFPILFFFHSPIYLP